MSFESARIAIIQESPIHLDLDATLDKATSLIDEAAKTSNLIVFGETWFSGYPAWLDVGRDVAIWDYPPMKEIYQKLHKSALVLACEHMNSLLQLSEDLDVLIGFGANEKVEGAAGNGSLYNSFFLIGKGEILVHHRKLMPTFSEKLVYTTGDANGLGAVDTKVGRIGGLICWEHWMPMVRQAMHDSEEHIHLALWPRVKPMNLMACQHYAFEGRCYVIAVGQMLANSQLPESLEYINGYGPSEPGWALDGGSCVVAPNGEVLLPQSMDAGIRYFEIHDSADAIAEKMTLDTSGHYQRRDVFDYSVNRSRK